MKEKLKSYLLNDQIFYGILIILVGCFSFILGQKSVQNPIIKSQSEIEFIESKPINTATSSKNESNVDNQEIVTTKQTSNGNDSSEVKIVASKNGTRYYYSTCGAVKRIKPENLISFASVEAAKAAGYTKALNCP